MMDNQETKTCQNCQKPFVIEPEDFLFYEKIKVPAPTWCPECREIRRIAFRNERSLYKRNCDLCGNNVVSRVSPDKPYPMYCNKCWYSDKWDSLSYGREYDFSKSFFEQFKELFLSAPHPALGASNNVNSDWVNQETDDKNCYLNVGGHFNEDSAYNTYEVHSRDCFDNWWIFKSELCYENINCERCHKTVFSRECFDCREVLFSSDCRNCHDIFGCAGLRNKSYHIFNEPVSKEKYEKFLKENNVSSYKNIRLFKSEAEDVRLKIPHRSNLFVKTASVSGNLISESKKSYNAWNAEKIEDCKNIYFGAWLKDCYDISSIGWAELCYEGAHSVGVYKGNFFAYLIGDQADKRHSFGVEYCFFAKSLNNCFGCVSLRNKEYCILNKQYTKQEYENLVSKIKEQMMVMPYVGKNGRVYKYGEFFPIEISPFGYNETAAQDYYPLTREGAAERGYSWSDYGSQTKFEFPDYEIPDDIKDVKDDILEKILKCEISGRAYKIIPQELAFYRKMRLPLPRFCPNSRHFHRIQQRNPLKLWHRACQCAGEKSEIRSTKSETFAYQNTAVHFHGNSHCPNEFETSYAPERPEIVYCEQCYQSEVV